LQKILKEGKFQESPEKNETKKETLKRNAKETKKVYSS